MGPHTLPTFTTFHLKSSTIKNENKIEVIQKKTGVQQSGYCSIHFFCFSNDLGSQIELPEIIFGTPTVVDHILSPNGMAITTI